MLKPIHVLFCLIFAIFGGKAEGIGFHPNLKIIGGNTTDIKHHPYQVSIWAGDEFRGSGALVRNGWVVTTASAVLGFDKSALKVRALSSNATEGGIVSTVSKMLTHPKFRFNSMSYDVALLKLTGVLNTKISHKVSLADHPLSANMTGMLSGWGSTSNSSKMSDQLQQVVTTVVDMGSCQNMYGENFVIGVSQFCAQAYDAFGPCWGDAGDLLVRKKKLYGLLSWNQGCFSDATPSVFTDLSISKKWINKAIR